MAFTWRVYVKKCTEFVVEGVWRRGRPKRTWKEVVEGYEEFGVEADQREHGRK